MSEKKTSPETSETTPVQKPVVAGPIETQQQALQVLVSGLQVAQSRGAFKIEESARLAEAIKLFQPAEEDKKPAAE
jgi:hypothetical protein|tara:strand:+ start:234 stop:461 length:228 start_codon:yes stop_codon:yes gene_type:complete